MFDFLCDWDDKLQTFEQDFELAIKYSGNSWVTSAQIFCERVMKLYNNEVRCCDTTNKLTLGTFINDSLFTADFQKRTSFNMWEQLRKLNSLSNGIKHNGSIPNISDSELVALFWAMHTLAIKTYNYLMKKSFSEKFDQGYIGRLKESLNEGMDTIIDYADNRLAENNETIANLLDDLDILNRFIQEDRVTIETLKDENETIKEINRTSEIMIDQLLMAARKAVKNNQISDLADLLFLLDEKPENITWLQFFSKIREQREVKVEKEKEETEMLDMCMKAIASDVDEEDRLAEYPDSYLDAAYSSDNEEFR